MTTLLKLIQLGFPQNSKRKIEKLKAYINPGKILGGTMLDHIHTFCHPVHEWIMVWMTGKGEYPLND